MLDTLIHGHKVDEKMQSFISSIEGGLYVSANLAERHKDFDTLAHSDYSHCHV